MFVIGNFKLKVYCSSLHMNLATEQCKKRWSTDSSLPQGTIFISNPTSFQKIVFCENTVTQSKPQENLNIGEI